MDPNVETLAEISDVSGTVFGIVLVAIVMLVAMLSAVSAVIAFMFTMTLLRVPEEHRKLTLGSIWFLMIPVFGIFWMWWITQRLADSFQSYFNSRDPDEVDIPPGDFGRKMGMLACGSAAVAHVAALMVLTKSLWALGLTLGPCVVIAMVLTGMYFFNVFRIRNRIPDPESAIPEDYL